jgi:hypothetical protein
VPLGRDKTPAPLAVVATAKHPLSRHNHTGAARTRALQHFVSAGVNPLARLVTANRECSGGTDADQAAFRASAFGADDTTIVHACVSNGQALALDWLIAGGHVSAALASELLPLAIHWMQGACVRSLVAAGATVAADTRVRGHCNAELDDVTLLGLALHRASGPYNPGDDRIIVMVRALIEGGGADACRVNVWRSSENEAPRGSLAVLLERLTERAARLDVIDALLEGGADPNGRVWVASQWAAVEPKSAPLSLAIENRHWGAVERLLAAGADLEAIDAQQRERWVRHRDAPPEPERPQCSVM